MALDAGDLLSHSEEGGGLGGGRGNPLRSGQQKIDGGQFVKGRLNVALKDGAEALGVPFRASTFLLGNQKRHFAETTTRCELFAGATQPLGEVTAFGRRHGVTLGNLKEFGKARGREVRHSCLTLGTLAMWKSDKSV